jgi:hypothetical protein
MIAPKLATRLCMLGLMLLDMRSVHVAKCVKLVDFSILIQDPFSPSTYRLTSKSWYNP